VATIYAATSALWISYSDGLLVDLSSGFGNYQILQTYKGWAFVALSALLIFGMLRLAWRGMYAAYESVAESERRLALALASAGGGIWEISLTDSKRPISIMHLSPELSARLGLLPSSTLSMEEVRERVHPEDIDEADRILELTISSAGEKPYSARYRLRTTAGDYLWVQANGNIILSPDGKPSRVLGVALDITDQVVAEQKLQNILRFDPATGLLRQNKFLAEIDALLASSSAEKAVAVVQFRLLDLDTLAEDGESLQDSRLVRLVGDRLRGLKGIIAARFATDVFALALNLPSKATSAQSELQRCLDDVMQPAQLGEHLVKLRALAGGATGPQAGASAIALVRNSGHAMVMADRATRAEIRWFNKELREEFTRRHSLLRGLENAVRNQEIECHFQPVIDVRSGRTWGFEALARWRRSEYELIPPDMFIPLAEEIGTIDDIGSEVLHQACRAANSWPDPYPMVAVNVSPLQLEDARFPASVARILAETGLPAGRLELEITETALAKNPDVAAERIKALREVGVQIAIDDFGTGYSSLSLLSKIPFTRLKIDRSFISKGEKPHRHGAISDMIISLAHSLGLSVTAEGIETLAQAQRLAGKGVECLQGFHFSQPVEVSKVAELVQKDWMPELSAASEAAIGRSRH
jgi:PAS domain S-box-containing protein